MSPLPPQLRSCVRVYIGRGAKPRVPEKFLREADVSRLCVNDRGRRRAKQVEPVCFVLAQSRCSEELDRAPSIAGLSTQRRAISPGKHEIIGPSPAGSLAVHLKDLRKYGGHVQRPPAPFRLRCQQLIAPQSAIHLQRVIPEVDILPPEPQQLAYPKPSQSNAQKQRAVLVLYSLDEPSDLISRQSGLLFIDQINLAVWLN